MLNGDRKSYEEIVELPIYKKAREISDLVMKIADLIPDDNGHLEDVRRYITENALLLPAKVVAAEGGHIYDLRMENATLVRKYARELMVSYHTLKMHDFEHAEYYMMVRELIEEFRLLFIDWVAGFDQWNYVRDTWGLFNPPGVSPFDEDSDEE